MAYIRPENHYAFLASAAPQKGNFASGASIQEKELPKIEHLRETVARLANGKPDLEQAEKVLSACIMQVRAILEIPNNEDKLSSEPTRLSFR